MAFEAALQGIVQGVTEFLPISSSGHLILARAFLGWDEGFGLAFDVACHVGTLLAVVLYFAPEHRSMLRALPSVADWTVGGPARQVRLLVIGTVPIVLAGYLGSAAIDLWLRNPAVAGLTLAVGGVGLLAADRWGRGQRLEGELTVLEVLAIGVAQAVALVPGVSRSGATITMALCFGLRREAAARFSFLLGVPAVTAAAAYEGVGLLRDGLPPGVMWSSAIGLATSGIVGFVTVKYFLRYVASHSLTAFAVYRFLLAGAALVWVVRGW